MKITELYFNKDEAKMIELHDGRGINGGIAFAGETLDDFLTEQEQWGHEGYTLSAAEINKVLKQCGIRGLAINTGFKTCVGTMFSVDGQYFCRKDTSDTGYYFKTAKWHNKRPIYLPENAEDMSDTWTGKDFIDLCGDVKLAKKLFNAVEWESPETRLNEWKQD